MTGFQVGGRYPTSHIKKSKRGSNGVDGIERDVVKLGQMEGEEDGRGRNSSDICDILDAGIWEGLEEEEGRGVEGAKKMCQPVDYKMKSW